MTPNERFGILLRDARVARGWSQQRVANRMRGAGFNWLQTTVAKSEAATRPVSIEEAAALGVIFDLDLNGLVSLDEILCPVCDGSPQAGFTCNECGESTP